MKAKELLHQIFSQAKSIFIIENHSLFDSKFYFNSNEPKFFELTINKLYNLMKEPYKWKDDSSYSAKVSMIKSITEIIQTFINCYQKRFSNQQILNNLNTEKKTGYSTRLAPKIHVTNMNDVQIRHLESFLELGDIDCGNSSHNSNNIPPNSSNYLPTTNYQNTTTNYQPNTTSYYIPNALPSSLTYRSLKCLDLIKNNIRTHHASGKPKHFFTDKLISKACSICSGEDRMYCRIYIKNYIENLYYSPYKIILPEKDETIDLDEDFDIDEDDEEEVYHKKEKVFSKTKSKKKSKKKTKKKTKKKSKKKAKKKSKKKVKKKSKK